MNRRNDWRLSICRVIILLQPLILGCTVLYGIRLGSTVLSYKAKNFRFFNISAVKKAPMYCLILNANIVYVRGLKSM